MSEISQMINSMPISVAERPNNELGVYIKETHNEATTKCLESILKNDSNGGNLGNYVDNLGEFNFKEAKNPVFTKGYWQPYKDYVENCPEGWADLGYGNCTKTTGYDGPCNAGRTKCNWEWRIQRYDTQYYNDYEPIYGWGWVHIYNQWYPCCSWSGWRLRCSSCYRPIYGWWKTQTGTRTIPRSRQVPVYGWQYICNTEPPFNFNGYGPNEKANWENSCKAYWITKYRWIPGYWSCNYGKSLDDDIAEGNIRMIGNAPDFVAATQLVLENGSSMVFGYGDGKVYIPKDRGSTIFQNKGPYLGNGIQDQDGTPHCMYSGPKITVYRIKDVLVDKLRECKNINDVINNTNDNIAEPVSELGNIEAFKNRFGKDSRYLIMGLLFLIMIIILFKVL